MLLALLQLACNGPNGPAPACLDGEIVDGEVCVPAACGVGTWGHIPLVEGTIFVDAASASGGDGAEGTPFQTLQDGLEAASDGGFVAVASGSYAGPFDAPKTDAAVTVAGRCADLVELDGGGAEDTPGFAVAGGWNILDFRLMDVTVTNGGYIGVFVEEANAVLEGVSLSGNALAGAGALGQGASLDLVDCTIDASHADDTYGIIAGDGATVSLDRVSVTGAALVGIYLEDTEAQGVDVSVLNTRGDADADSGFGIATLGGGAFSCERCLVEGALNTGVFVLGGSLSLADSQVRDVGVGALGTGFGVYGYSETSVSLVGVTVAGCAGAGLTFSGGAAKLVDVDVSDITLDNFGTGYGLASELADINIANLDVTNVASAGMLSSGGSVTASGVHITGAGENGINIQTGASLDAEDCHVSDSVGDGFAIIDATATLTACSVQDPIGAADGLGGRGISAQDGGVVTVTDSWVSGGVGAGVIATGEGSRAVLVNTDVRDGVLNSAEYGVGVQAEDGASVTVDGGRIEGNMALGAAVLQGGATLALADCVVVGTLANGAVGGYGVEIDSGGSATLVRTSVEDSVGVGVFVAGVADIDASTITGTRSATNGDPAKGLEVAPAGTVTMSGTTIDDTEGVGVLAIGEDATLEIQDSTISETLRPRSLGIGAGLMSEYSARVNAVGLTVVGTEGPGLYVSAAGEVACSGCTLSLNTFAGALAAGGVLTLSGTTIEGTSADASVGGGLGAYTVGENTLTLTDSLIGPHPYAAVWLDGAGSYDLQGNTLHGSTGTDDGLFGYAIYAQLGIAAWDGANGLNVGETTFQGGPEVAVMLHGATATFAENTWQGTATDVRQQLCEGILPLEVTELDDAPVTVICPEGNALVPYDLVFDTLYLSSVEPAP